MRWDFFNWSEGGSFQMSQVHENLCKMIETGYKGFYSENGSCHDTLSSIACEADRFVRSIIWQPQDRVLPDVRRKEIRNSINFQQQQLLHPLSLSPITPAPNLQTRCSELSPTERSHSPQPQLTWSHRVRSNNTSQNVRHGQGRNSPQRRRQWRKQVRERTRTWRSNHPSYDQWQAW